MAKKIPISINEQYEKQIRELGALIGQNPNQYGYIPKTLRFAILYTLNDIKRVEKLIPDLPTNILEDFLLTIKRMKMNKYSKIKQEKQEK